MADTSSIPPNLKELIASHTKFDGAPNIPENAWVEVQFSENGQIFNLLQIPRPGTLGLVAEAYNLQHLCYWHEEKPHDLELGNEYSLPVHPGDAIIWQFAEGSQASFKMAWWFEESQTG